MNHPPILDDCGENVLSEFLKLCTLMLVSRITFRFCIEKKKRSLVNDILNGNLINYLGLASMVMYIWLQSQKSRHLPGEEQ